MQLAFPTMARGSYKNKLFQKYEFAFWRNLECLLKILGFLDFSDLVDPLLVKISGHKSASQFNIITVASWFELSFSNTIQLSIWK